MVLKLELKECKMDSQGTWHPSADAFPRTVDTEWWQTGASPKEMLRVGRRPQQH